MGLVSQSDEIDFLEGITSKQREEEERIKRETEDELAVFRAAREKLEGGEGAGEDEQDDVSEQRGNEDVVRGGPFVAMSQSQYRTHTTCKMRRGCPVVNL